MPRYAIGIEDGSGMSSEESSQMGYGDNEICICQVIGLKGDGTESVEIQMTGNDDRQLPEEERGWTTCIDHLGNPMVMYHDDIESFHRCDVNTRAIYDGDISKDDNAITVYLK